MENLGMNTYLIKQDLRTEKIHIHVYEFEVK